VVANRPKFGRGVGIAAGRAGTMRLMDERPPTDPSKLLADWMEWERGDTPPGRVMSNLKTHGMREVLERLASEDRAG
jgi:hypothetical protein